jgi:hypothetical protein
MSPSVTFTEPSTSAVINPNDYLRLETNDVHIVQRVHSFLGSHVSQTNRTSTWLCKCNTRRHGDLSLLSCINRNRLTWSWPICCLLWGSLRLCTCFWSTSVRSKQNKDKDETKQEKNQQRIREGCR